MEIIDIAIKILKSLSYIILDKDPTIKFLRSLEMHKPYLFKVKTAWSVHNNSDSDRHFANQCDIYKV